MKQEFWVYAFIYSKTKQKFAFVRYFESGYHWLIGWRIEKWESIINTFNREAKEEIWEENILDRFEYKVLDETYEYDKIVNWEKIHKTDNYFIIFLDNDIDLKFIEDEWEIVWLTANEYLEISPYEEFREYFINNVLKEFNF